MFHVEHFFGKSATSLQTHFLYLTICLPAIPCAFATYLSSSPHCQTLSLQATQVNARPTFCLSVSTSVKHFSKIQLFLVKFLPSQLLNEKKSGTESFQGKDMCRAGEPLQQGKRLVFMSGRRDSNPQLQLWESCTLPVELRPQTCSHNQTILQTFSLFFKSR